MPQCQPNKKTTNTVGYGSALSCGISIDIDSLAFLIFMTKCHDGLSLVSSSIKVRLKLRH